MRSSHFSLDFSTIGPSNAGETRGKVDPYCKGYVWVPVLWGFDKLRKIGFFSYLDILCLKIHKNNFGCCEAGKGHGFRSHKSGTDA